MPGILTRELCKKALKEHFQVASLESLGIADYDCGVTASGALLQYLIETQKTSLAHLTKLTTYSTGKIYGAGQLHKEKSGALRDSAGEAEAWIPSLGAG